MPNRVTLLALLTIMSIPVIGTSQAVAPKNATAVSLLSSAVSALAGGTDISSVTLTGTVTRTAGSNVETGSATLEALGGTDSRISLMLTNGQRTQIINQSHGAPAGQWSGTDGTPHAMAEHNCWVPADWFFPALALGEAVNDPAVTITYIGEGTLDGLAVQHIRFARVFPSSSGSAADVALLERLTTAGVYLDAANSLPVELDFNLHPDSNALINIPVEIRYGNYQKINGILLPTHIQKLINHSLSLDLNLTGAITNTNLSSTDFAVTSAGQ